MTKPELTPELLAQMDGLTWLARPATDEDRMVGRVDGHLLISEGRGRDSWRCEASEMEPQIAQLAAAALNALPSLVAAAKERDQLREAADICEAARLRLDVARLRERATLEAWSGSLSGLDAAGEASARATALEQMAGIDAPTAEQQRDAAMTKLAAVLVERNQLRAQNARLEESQQVHLAQIAELGSLRAEVAQLRSPLAGRHPEEAEIRVALARATIERDLAKQEVAELRRRLAATAATTTERKS